MKFLKEVRKYKFKDEFDLSMLPDEQMKEIQKLIKIGAEKSDKWGTALDLVHKAYKLLNIDRPNPDMKAGWEQYEINIQYAIEQLAKNHGVDGDWRLTSTSLKEQESWEVTYKDQSIILNNVSLDDIKNHITNSISENTKIITKHKDDCTILECYKYGVVRSDIIKIKGKIKNETE